MTSQMSSEVNLMQLFRLTFFLIAPAQTGPLRCEKDFRFYTVEKRMITVLSLTSQYHGFTVVMVTSSQ